MTTVSLIAIVALLFAFVPEEALAKTRAKPSPGNSFWSGPLVSGQPQARARARAKAKKKAGRAHVTARTKARRPVRSGKGERKRVCADSYTKAKELIGTAHLIDAKELLGKCARKECGSFLKQECTTLYTQMNSDIPSVVLLVTTAAGAPGETKVEVMMDGERLTDKADGRAIPIDPGAHEFTFSGENGVFARQKIVAAQGQRNRPISALLPSQKTTAAARAVAEKAPPPESAEADREREREVEVESDEGEPRVVARKGQTFAGQASWPVYALGGGGVVALGTAGLLTYWARKDNSMLSECTPNCQPGSVRHIRRLYLAADISIGVGLVALAASTWLYVRSPGTEEKASTHVAHLNFFDVQPTPSGAFATIGGSF